MFYAYTREDIFCTSISRPAIVSLLDVLHAYNWRSYNIRVQLRDIPLTKAALFR